MHMHMSRRISGGVVSSEAGGALATFFQRVRKKASHAGSQRRREMAMASLPGWEMMYVGERCSMTTCSCDGDRRDSPRFLAEIVAAAGWRAAEAAIAGTTA